MLHKVEHALMTAAVRLGTIQLAMRRANHLSPDISHWLEGQLQAELCAVVTLTELRDNLLKDEELKTSQLGSTK